MAITGIHGLLYTTQPEELRAVLRDVFGWDHVNAGDSWLVMVALPGVDVFLYEPRHPTAV